MFILQGTSAVLARSGMTQTVWRDARRYVTRELAALASKHRLKAMMVRRQRIGAELIQLVQHLVNGLILRRGERASRQTPCQWVAIPQSTVLNWVGLTLVISTRQRLSRLERFVLGVSTFRSSVL